MRREPGDESDMYKTCSIELSFSLNHIFHDLRNDRISGTHPRLSGMSFSTVDLTERNRAEIKFPLKGAPSYSLANFDIPVSPSNGEG